LTIRKLFDLHWQTHWQNLDDREKRERAEAALTGALRQLGVLTNDRWREISAARSAFNEKLRGKLGHGWRNGRAWLYVYRGDPDAGGKKFTTLGVQWLLLKRPHSVGVTLNVGGGDSDRDIDVSVRVPGASLYVSVEDALPRRLMFRNPGQKYPSSRELGITWHSQALWFAFWRDPDESYGRGGPSFWKDARSAQRHIVIHPLDMLFGRTSCVTEQLGEQPAEVELPEARYPVRVVFERRTWARPRWPWWRSVRVSADVRSEAGIPIPGKGENGYDCDDDAYYSIGTHCTTVAEAVQTAAARVLETRQRYGGEDWRPAPSA